MAAWTVAASSQQQSKARGTLAVTSCRLLSLVSSVTPGVTPSTACFSEVCTALSHLPCTPCPSVTGPPSTKSLRKANPAKKQAGSWFGGIHIRPNSRRGYSLLKEEPTNPSKSCIGQMVGGKFYSWFLSNMVFLDPDLVLENRETRISKLYISITVNISYSSVTRNARRVTC